MKKDKVIKMASNIMLLCGTEALTFPYIANRTGLREEKLSALFPNGEQELKLDTIEYAGREWVEQIKNQVAAKESTQEKMSLLIERYAMGTKDFPQALSAYVDMWKVIKDGGDSYIRNRLKGIYNYYISEFIHIARDIGFDILPERELASFAFLLTVLSDVIHLQSVVLRNEIDFFSISRVIRKMAAGFLQEQKHG